MRLYGHIAHKDSLPGPALCGKPNRVASGPARLYCGKCVVAVIAEVRARPVVNIVNIGGGGAA